MQERLLGGREVELDAELRGQRFQHSLQREEVGRLAAAAPRALRQRPDRDPREPVRLGERRRLVPGEPSSQRVDGPISIYSAL